MKFGCFDDQAREYVITRPDTPLPAGSLIYQHALKKGVGHVLPL